MIRIASALTGFAVGWFISLLEYFFTATAWGGPFTILMIPVVAAVVSAASVGVAALLGLLLRLPMIRDVWRRAGYRVLFLAVVPISVLLFSSFLGLRSIDPVSGYSLLSPWVSIPCYILIVFPFVNLPRKPKIIPQQSNHDA